MCRMRDNGIDQRVLPRVRLGNVQAATGLSVPPSLHDALEDALSYLPGDLEDQFYGHPIADLLVRDAPEPLSAGWFAFSVGSSGEADEPLRDEQLTGAREAVEAAETGSHRHSWTWALSLNPPSGAARQTAH